MISNDTYAVRRITPEFVWWKDAFSTKQLDDFENYCGKYELDEGKIIYENSESSGNDIRLSKIKFFQKTSETSWIFDIFNNTIYSINDQFYQMDLYGYNEFQYTTYHGHEKGKYDWHMDTVLGENISGDMKIFNTRKLTLVMLLNDKNDFTGGDFQINLRKESDPITIPIERGMIIAFPSFLIHRVTPVLSGVRKSIVIWVEGPKFR